MAGLVLQSLTTGFKNFTWAAGCAAPFVLLTCLIMSFAFLTPTIVLAKMRADTLTIVSAESGAAVSFDVEIAVTEAEKALGLMYRTNLPLGRGMLFPYANAHEITMWMRNTYIPLDMLFIRSDGSVHRIEANTQPLSESVIASGGPVTAVLEIAGGSAAKFGIKPGDKVRHAIFSGDASGP